LAALETVDSSWPIFLMTDDAQCLAQMKNTYGRRIIATECQRTDTDEGVHYLPTVDPVRAGREIMIDTHLALRADRFIGNGLSNVSAMIAVMKDWAPGCLSLIGRSILRERNLHIYQIPTFAGA
jgi:protein O-GlcNAc transferase